MIDRSLTRRTLVLGTSCMALVGGSAFALVSDNTLPKVVVNKDPSCGCCRAWADHIRAAGFPVEIVETKEINRVKVRLGVPSELASCHTAEVADYVVEGHVPADALKRLLQDTPQATGLAVPGMPMGSPGMEMDGMAPDTYEVVLFSPGGRSTYARYQGSRQL